MLYMTPNIVRNLLSAKATRGYPFEVREPFPGYRGELVNDSKKCILCSMCAKKCPSQCITVDREKQVWVCDPYACIYCSVCVDNCPVQSLSMVNAHRKPAAAKSLYEVPGTIRKKAAPKAKAAAKPAEAAGAADAADAADAAEAKAPAGAEEKKAAPKKAAAKAAPKKDKDS